MMSRSIVSFLGRSLVSRLNVKQLRVGSLSTTFSVQNHCNHVRHCSSDTGYTPRRAVLYVPGSEEKKLRKIPSLNVDCAVMDCEDGVALNRKTEARETICKVLGEMDFGRTERCVRVNSVSSGLAEEDLRVILQAKRLPMSLVLPKVDQPDDLKWFAEKFSGSLEGRSVDEKIKLIIMVESAIGLLNLRDTCQQAVELSENHPFVIDGMIFGSDDFCADIGATRTPDAKELLYARQKTVLIAKAFRLQAVDLVHINYKDLDSLHLQSEEGARMGFTGKQVIHPSQIPVVQKAFYPSPEKVEWASELIRAFDSHQDSGRGAFTFRGQMIDMPTVLQAKNITQLAEAIQDSQL